MSRHRNVRNMDYDDFDDGYYDEHYDDYGATPPGSYGSPGAAQLFAWPGAAPAVEIKGLGGAERSPPEQRNEFVGQGPEEVFAFDEPAPKKMVTPAQMQEVRAILGNRFNNAAIMSALEDCDCVVEQAVNILLEKEPQKAPVKNLEEVEVLSSARPKSSADLKTLEAAGGGKNGTKPKVDILAGKTGADRTVEKGEDGDELADDMAAFGFKTSQRNDRDDDGGFMQGFAAPISPRAPVSPRLSPRQGYKQSKLSKQIGKEVEEALAANNGTDAINLVVVGHVDAGKSTIMGHLLYLVGEVNKKVIHKYEKESNEQGKGSFAFAWVLDGHEEERARGITMDVAVTHFETKRKAVTILDAPGHRDFIPNMISGAAMADVAILVVSSTKGEFEAGFESDGQTKEHAVLLRSLGVQQLIVAVNKLDTVGWSKDRFDEIVASLGAFLKQTGFKSPFFVPVSGLGGINLLAAEKGDGLPAELTMWYSGPSLVDAIDELAPVERETAGPLRMAVSDVYKSTSMSALAVAGKVETGVIKLDDKVFVMPLGEVCTVKGIERRGDSVRWACAGDNIDVGLADLDPSATGAASFLCDLKRPIPMARRVAVQMMVMDVAVPITKGYEVLFHYQNFNEPAVVSKLVSIIGKGGNKKAKPRRLGKGETAECEITLQRPMCLEAYNDCKPLGRFLLREGGRTIGAGVIKALLPDKKKR